MTAPERCLIRVERARRGLTPCCEDPRAVRLLPQQVRQLTCSASELKRNCDQNNGSKRQECHQASNRQSATIAPNEFRHFSRPSSQAKRGRSGGSHRRAARRVSEAEYAGSTGAAKHQEKAPTEAGLVDGVVVQLGFFQPHLGRVVLRSEKIRRVALNKKKAPVLDTQPGLELKRRGPGRPNTRLLLRNHL